nr:EAL domain-containing protein [Planosporangium mesophilum]
MARVGPRAGWGPLVTGIVSLALAAAIGKVVLAGGGPVDQGALRLLGFGLLVCGLAAGAADLIADQPHLLPAQLSVPYLAVLTVLAADRQQQRAFAGERPPAPPRWRGPLNPLPVVVVAVVDVLLLSAVAGRVDGRRYVVVGGVIALTGLVVARQAAALADNARLARRLRQQEERLSGQNRHDPLTRLVNRAHFADRLEAALVAGPVTVLLVDLDDFKTVNDTLGHRTGDRLLAAVADRVEGCVRPGDTVARLGGDEFAVLLRQAWPPAVDAVAESILASLRRPVVVDGYELLVQASIGVTEAGTGDDPESLLRKADIAMYAAKESGKDSFARYQPGMGADILDHAQLGAQLRQALDGGQLTVRYQPVVRLADRRIIGMEALVRWRHPERGEISPGDFIPTAERTGLIVPLGRWVLREACRQKAAWREAYGDSSPSTIGVNVSGRQLLQPGFADEVADAVHEAGLEPHHLVLEVTENAVLTGGQAFDTLHALRAFGVKIALDDFGTGQSSLRLIRTCPVHILKLDKSFVLAAATTGTQARRQAAVASAVLRIAEDLELDAVAEGIENAEHADRMAALGYRLGQGYHLVRPLPAGEIGALLAREVAPR